GEPRMNASGKNSESAAWVKNWVVPIMPGPAGTMTPTTWMARMVATISGAMWKPKAGARSASPNPLIDQYTPVRAKNPSAFHPEPRWSAEMNAPVIEEARSDRRGENGRKRAETSWTARSRRKNAPVTATQRAKNPSATSTEAWRANSA